MMGNFQRLCQNLLDYTDSITIELTDEELHSEIEQRARQYYLPLLNGNALLPGVCANSKSRPENEKQFFIENQVMSMYSYFVERFQTAIQYMNMGDECQQSLNWLLRALELLGGPGKTDEEYQQIVESPVFIGTIKGYAHSYVSEIWRISPAEWGMQGREPIYVSIDQEKLFACKMEQTCCEAFELLGQEPPEWTSGKSIAEGWMAYNTVYDMTQGFKVPHISSIPGFAPKEIALMRALFTCRVLEEYRNCIQMTAYRFRMLQSCVRTYRKNNQ